MTALEKFTSNTSVELYGPNKVIDPSVFALIELLAQIIVPLIEKCMDARQARLAAGNPTPLQKVWLNAKVRHEMGRKEFREQDGRELVNAALRSFSKLSESEVQALFDEV